MLSSEVVFGFLFATHLVMSVVFARSGADPLRRMSSVLMCVGFGFVLTGQLVWDDPSFGRDATLAAGLAVFALAGALAYRSVNRPGSPPGR